MDALVHARSFVIHTCFVSFVGGIRCGLVFQLKEQVGECIIEEREKANINFVKEKWGQHDNIELFGKKTHQRLAVFSFLVCKKKKSFFSKFLPSYLYAFLLICIFRVQ